MSDEHATVLHLLRSRVLRGLRAGTLKIGDRLPSAREVATEVRADHRLVLAVYRELQDEGLVQVRERGGVYVAAQSAAAGDVPEPAARWLAGIFADALARDIAGPELPELIRRATDTINLRALVVTSSEDEGSELARELVADFGVRADAVTGASVAEATQLHLALRRADFVVCTPDETDAATRVANELQRPLVVVSVQTTMLPGDWAVLLRQEVWVVVATPQFERMLRRLFAEVRGAENLRVLVLGRDDLAQIPEGAPTYLTQRVRSAIDLSAIRGRILPAERTIAQQSAKEIFEVIVSANLRAARAVRESTANRSPATA